MHLLLFSVLCNSLLAVEYGYITVEEGEQHSDKVFVPAGFKFVINETGTSNWRLDGSDNICIDRDGETLKSAKGSGNYTWPNKEIYGPCEVYLEVNGQNSYSRPFLPYSIESLAYTSSQNIVIPANEVLENNDLIIQYSEDLNNWSNVSSGIVSQGSTPKYFRLLMENINNEIQQANINFGFGSNSPQSVSYHQKFMESSLPVSGIFLSLNEGEVFRPLKNASFNTPITFKIYYTNHHFNELLVFEYYNDNSITGAVALIGPATLTYFKEGSSVNSNDAMLAYSITTNLEQAQLSGGTLTIPSGNSTYNVKIQYSEDLTNDWIDLQSGADIDSSNIRFYRLTAVQNN